jgi:hypothetical protein
MFAACPQHSGHFYKETRLLQKSRVSEASQEFKLALTLLTERGK